MEFDPLSGELSRIYTLPTEADIHYAGGAVNINGDIYALPVHADNMLKISFGGDITIPDELYDSFFADFY